MNITERTNIISNYDNEEFFFDFNTMAEKAEKMLKMSLDALVNLDIDLAFKILTLDDEVDRIKNEAYDEIKKAMKNTKGEMAYLINLLLISRHLERLADHAINIAEEVIYLVEGEIVRHGKY